MKIKQKKWLKKVGMVLAVLLLLVLTVPLLIPINGEVGLKEPSDLLDADSDIVTIPFEGTDGLDLYYDYRINEDFEDRNFILLHGSLYNSKSWSEVIDFFSEYGNVYAYDQLGYGLSEKVLEGDWTGKNPYSTGAATEQLISFMDMLSIESATLVGSSFGGVISAELAINSEDRVEKVILVDPAILVTESMPKWLVELPQVEHIGPVLGAYLIESDGFYESTFYNMDLLTAERMTLSKRETLVNNWNLAFWEYLQAWSVTPSDVSERLDDINQPVLVISGDQDKIVPVGDSEEIASRIADATFVAIDDCGHMPHEEKPDEFMVIVGDWLSNKDIK